MKIKKTVASLLVAVALFSVVLQANNLHAAFRFRSSGFGSSLRSSGSSSHSGGFSLFKSWGKSSASRVGTFRSRINSRNSVLRTTQSRVNNRTRNFARTSSYGNNHGMYNSWGSRNPFWHSFTGGFVGSMVSRMIFGGHGYYGGGYHGGSYYGGGYYQGPGMIMSTFINFIVILVVIILVFKLFKAMRRRNNTPIYDYAPEYSNIIDENDADFENQNITLTRQDAKNYINDLPINSQDKLTYLNALDSFTTEEQIVDYVEQIERNLDSDINVSLEDGKKQGQDYVINNMTWLSSEDKNLIIEKINRSNTLEEIEHAIAPFDK